MVHPQHMLNALNKSSGVKRRGYSSTVDGV
nr:MAG TPA: hypothetical protein [Caudoviricetes sp.]